MKAQIYVTKEPSLFIDTIYNIHSFCKGQWRPLLKCMNVQTDLDFLKTYCIDGLVSYYWSILLVLQIRLDMS